MRFGWTVFVVTWLFVFSGKLLMESNPLFVAIDFATAVVGVRLNSATIMG